MSWTSGNKKWTIPFVSLNGTNCHIDIYKRGYTGSAVVELSPTNQNAPGYAAADPIFFEEDSEEDLLTVVRYKTGYINLVEITYNGLIDLYPEHDTDHYIEFYYGNSLEFTGYIQAQSFENDWVASPRKIQIPIQSPVGLCEGLYFADVAPSVIYRDNYLSQIISGMDAAYTGCIFPDNVISFALRSIIICELNENINKLDGSDLYTPKTFKEWLESFCYVFGLILHDTPTKLVFTRFEENGAYNGTTAVGSTVRNIGDFFTIGSNKHKESVVQPLKNIRVDYDGSALTGESMSLSQMPFISKTSGELSVAAYFKMMSPRFTDVAHMDSYGITNNKPSATGVSGAVAGGYGGQVEGILVYASNWNAGYKLFSYNFFNYPILADGENCVLKISMVRSQYLYQLAGVDDEDDTGVFLNFSVSVTYENGNKEYYNPTSYDWSSTETMLGPFYGPDSNGMWLRNVPIGASLNVNFYYWGTTALSVGYLAMITDISVTATKTVEWSYKYSQEFSRTIDGAAGAKKSGSYGLLFNLDLHNDHSAYNPYFSPVSYTTPTYSYMFLSQNRLQVQMKVTNGFPDDVYITKWAFWVTGWRWRIIAISFDPWNDLYTLTLHRSSIIE